MKIIIMITLLLAAGICMASQVSVLPIEKVAGQIKNVYKMKVLSSSLKAQKRTFKNGVTRKIGYEETCRCELENVLVGKWGSKKKIITIQCQYFVSEVYDDNGKLIIRESELVPDLGLRILRSNSKTIKKGTSFILCTTQAVDADSGKFVYPTRIVPITDKKKLMNALAKVKKK